MLACDWSFVFEFVVKEQFGSYEKVFKARPSTRASIILSRSHNVLHPIVIPSDVTSDTRR